jgi:site-specific DNA-adenine methylase
MRVAIPPIKSQGIKTKLVPWIQAITPDVPGRWVEPFLGTGVVGFNSGFQDAILSDTNPHVIAFYQAVKDRLITPSVIREYLSPTTTHDMQPSTRPVSVSDERDKPDDSSSVSMRQGQ